MGICTGLDNQSITCLRKYPNITCNLMRFLLFILFSLALGSCIDQSSTKVLQMEKDSNGRIIKEVTEGYEYGEGSYYRTTFFDTLGRITKIFEVKDYNKTVNTYEYSDSSTYEFIYYDLGHTNSYTDSNFIVTEKDISFIKHVRLNSKGTEIYEYQKWLDDSIYCQETFYDSLGREISFKEINCR